MPAGLRIRNESGIVQIDDRTINFALKVKGSVTTSTPWSTGGVTKYITTIVVTNCASPMLALACTDKVAHYYTSVSGTTWTFHILTLVNGATVNYWVFDRPAEPPPRSPGDVIFDIRNAAGDLVFWVEAKPLRIVGVGSGTFASGRVYATIQTAPGWGFFETNPGGATIFYRAWYGASAINSNVVVAGPGAIGPSAPGILFESYSFPGTGPESYESPAYQFLVVDVTNF